MKNDLIIAGIFPRRPRPGTLAPKSRAETMPVPPAPPARRVPRSARLMALALHLEALVQQGTVPSYAELARLGHVSRARLSQILSLVNLAPDLQEELLFWECGRRGHDPVPLRYLLPLAGLLNWQEQRRRWRQLRQR
jgi:hypothetical protein